MSDVKQIEEHFLPRELRLDLCMSLLEESGADRITLREDRGEIIHNCLMPWHTERNPSASLNFDSLTYRCLGCNAAGGMYWLIATIKGLEYHDVREWMSGTTGLGGKDFQLGPLLQFLDAVEESKAKGRIKTAPPRYPEVAIEKWTEHIYPGLTTGVPDLNIPGRGIPEQNLRDAKVGWDMQENRIVIPNFWQGSLVGWQSRRILDDGTPKYKSTPDFPRDSTILGLPGDTSRILVVESPMSHLKHRHHLPVASTWGATITPSQIQILKWYREVCFWLDNDEAGWKQIEGYHNEKGQFVPGAAHLLLPYTNVTVVESDWHADPAEFDDDEAEDLYASRVPHSVWQRPSGALRCRSCRQQHGGLCAPKEA